MNDLKKLLREKGVVKDVVIDDAYYEIPRPDELGGDDWTNFFDDLGEEDESRLWELLPDFKDAGVEKLKSSSEFLAELGRKRENLRIPALDRLFEQYVRKKQTEREELDGLCAALGNLGLQCDKAGSEFGERAREADLVFIDLFLGVHQAQDAMERAIETISSLVSTRRGNPPLVILMSRSGQLLDKRNEFRDRAGLLGSLFRVKRKKELTKRGAVNTLVARLANHYEDAKRMAAFVDVWDNSLSRAKDNFIRELRRLDLIDLAQMRALLLDFEGQNLGQYLLDVADRVLQHEIEAVPDTIEAAKALNEIELDNYPAPHLTGSSDLQNLVHRMVFQHKERLNLSYKGADPDIQYGDVLRCRDRKSGALKDEVFLVVTPACDLAREKEESVHVLVLPGILLPLTPTDWRYLDQKTPKTPIVEIKNEKTRWIKWSISQRRTFTLDQLRNGLGKGKWLDRLGRIREIYTTEIQQRMLADMGRIGMPANPPATFPVKISLYAVSPAGTAVSVEVDGMDTAVCYVGRDTEGKRVHRLVLSEDACDTLKGSILAYPTEQVTSRAGQSLQALKTDNDFFERFEKGTMEIPVNRMGRKEVGPADNGMAYIQFVRNDDVEEGERLTGNALKVPFVLTVSDIPSMDEQ